MYAKPPIASNYQQKYILDTNTQVLGIGEVNYAKYDAKVCLPGKVISSKTGKEYTPSLNQIGKRTVPKKTGARANS